MKNLYEPVYDDGREPAGHRIPTPGYSSWGERWGKWVPREVIAVYEMDTVTLEDAMLALGHAEPGDRIALVRLGNSGAPTPRTELEAEETP